jgi:hypothetical protein
MQLSVSRHISSQERPVADTDRAKAAAGRISTIMHRSQPAQKSETLRLAKKQA